MSSDYQTLRVRVEPGALVVTLDRPTRQNSINDVVLRELHHALDDAERQPACRLVVLEGSDGVFCTGMDLADATQDGQSLAERGGELFFGLLKRLTTTPRVVVACVDGRAVGGGVGLAAASDFVYATPRSTFSLPEALWGLLPCCVLPFLVRRVGFQPAHAMTLSTLPLSAEHAHRIHLVDELSEETGGHLRRLRSRLTKMDASTIGDAKAYIGGLWFLSPEMEQLAVSEFGRLMSSPSVRERISSFADHQALPWETRPSVGGRR